MARNPRGFVPCRSLHGHTSFVTRQYPVSANNPSQIFPGDPVILTADGNVRRVDTSGGVTVLDNAVLGVVRACYDSNRKPLTHSQPTRGPFLPVSTAGFVDVLDDPDVTFVVNADATILDSDIGKWASVTAGGANTAAGISGFSIQQASTTVSSAGQKYRILGLAPAEGKFPNEQGSADTDVEVMIADHTWRRRFNRVDAT